jgi:hypothetical protein
MTSPTALQRTTRVRKTPVRNVSSLPSFSSIQAFAADKALFRAKQTGSSPTTRITLQQAAPTLSPRMIPGIFAECRPVQQPPRVLTTLPTARPHLRPLRTTRAAREDVRRYPLDGATDVQADQVFRLRVAQIGGVSQSWKWTPRAVLMKEVQLEPDES